MKLINRASERKITSTVIGGFFGVYLRVILPPYVPQQNLSFLSIRTEGSDGFIVCM